MERVAALDVLRAYPDDAVVSDFYDYDDEFSGALNGLFPGFEYPDFSHRTMKAVISAGMVELKAQEATNLELCGQFGLVGDVTAGLVIDDRYAETIIGDRAEDYDALEVHGVRDQNAPGDSAGTNFEIDDQNPQSFSVYAHLVEGGVDSVGDFSGHKAAADYAADLSKAHGWVVTDFSRDGADLEKSRTEAQEIASQKGQFGYADLSTDRPISGRVMGVTNQHVVLSLGRSATILGKSDLSRVPAKGEDVTIAVKGGKAIVADQKAKEVDRGR